MRQDQGRKFYAPPATRSNFLRALLTETRAQLEAAGFTYRGRSWYERPLGSETTAIVTLASNTYRGDSAIYINPSLGIRHERLEELLAELSGHQLGKYPAATISTSLGYVSPDGKHALYSFTPGDELSAKVKGLVRTISKDGLAWMLKYETLDSLLEGLVTFKYSPRDQARLRIPLVHYLVGDYDSARLSLQEEGDQLAANHDVYSDQYRRLAQGLSTRLGPSS